jgi:hypothetical protein
MLYLNGLDTDCGDSMCLRNVGIIAHDLAVQRPENRLNITIIYKLLAKLGSNMYIFHFYHCLPFISCGMIWGAVSRLTCQRMQRLSAGGQ